MMRQRIVTTSLLLMCVALVAATPSRCGVRSSARPQPLGKSNLNAIVGQVPGRCCRPGRRFGCDPDHFRLSGCVPIDLSNPPRCSSGKWQDMLCTSAYCRQAGPEDICHLHNVVVGRNSCKPTGRITTIGCGEDEWQCEILMRRYDSPDAALTTAMVCLPDSTICALPYAFCD